MLSQIQIPKLKPNLDQSDRMVSDAVSIPVVETRLTGEWLKLNLPIVEMHLTQKPNQRQA